MEDFNNYRDTERFEHTQIPPVKKKKSSPMIIMALVCSLLGGLVGGSIVYVAKDEQNKNTQSNAVQTINISSENGVGIVEAVAKKALPSVVGVTTVQTQRSFLGPVKAQGSGSGVIVDTRGYILTNAHVVNSGNVENCTVLFNDGKEVEGKVIWADSKMDLAIVKIETNEKLQAAELGDSDKLNVGEIAVAIGNPLGLEFQKSVTSGVISGLNRNLGQVEGNYMEGLIQTDASINRGNSGGPLLNSKGQVIGLNTIKIGAAGTEGLGFSIPINTIKPIIDDVVKMGNYQRVSLGISGVNVDKVQESLNFKLKVEEGVVVWDLNNNSPAANAGIKPYDIIIGLGNEKISNIENLQKALKAYNQGDKVELTIIREDQEMKVDVEF